MVGMSEGFELRALHLITHALMVWTSQPASARACSGPRMLAAITCYRSQFSRSISPRVPPPQ